MKYFFVFIMKSSYCSVVKSSIFKISLHLALFKRQSDIFTHYLRVAKI